MLLQNITLLAQLPLRRSGATTVNTENGVMLSCFGPVGPAGFTRFIRFPEQDGMPEGYNPGIMMPLRHEFMSSSLEAGIAVTGQATGQTARPASGSATLSLSSSATANLIVSGSGEASFQITATGAIQSVASGSGSAGISLSTTGLLGAQAGLFGTGTISASATGTLQAIGYMSGLSSNETQFSETVLAQAVWTAQSASYNQPGSMGEKLNDASAAGNPWSADLSANNTPGTFGALVQKLLTVAKFLGLK
jgi:hypothetical protein